MDGRAQRRVPWANTLARVPHGLVAVLALASTARAHDSWVIASKSSVEPGRTVRVAFVTGETFPVSEHAAAPQRVASWVIAGAGRRSAVEGFAVDGMELAAQVRVARPGVHVVVVALHPRFIELDGPAFGEYLREEKARAALAEREERGEQDRPGREMYTKCGKAFIEAGETAGDTAYREPVGHPLEIVPLSNPCRWNAGDEVLVRVLLEGRPAAAQRVSSGREGLPQHTYEQHATTDRDGVARIRLSDPGLWFLRTHVIRRIGAGTGTGPEPGAASSAAADWESFWASITFRVAEAPSR